MGTLQPIETLGKIAHTHGSFISYRCGTGGGTFTPGYPAVTLIYYPYPVINYMAHRSRGTYMSAKSKVNSCVGWRWTELQLRSGTQAVPYSGGFGLACQLAARIW